MAGNLNSQYDIYDTGCDKNLVRGAMSDNEIPNLSDQDPTSSIGSNGGSDSFNGGLNNTVDQVTVPGSIISGELTSVLFTGKKTFTDTTAGYRMGIDSDNTYKWIIGGPSSSIDWNVTTPDTLTVIGSINVTAGGTVGGFQVGSDYIRDVANSFGLSSTVTGGNDVRIWAGDTFANRGIAPFRVYEDGSIVATGLTVDHLDIPDTTTANSFHVDTAGLLWSGANVANKATAPVRLNPTGEMTLGSPSSTHLQLSGPSVYIKSSNYVTGSVGFSISPTLVEAENIIARGTMSGSAFKYDVISAIGGQVMVANSDVLSIDMTAADASTLTIRGDATFAVNDILLIRNVATSGIQEEWFRVTNVGSAPTYTVTRDLAATYGANANPVWKAGTPVVKQGKSDGAAAFSGGWLRLFGEGTNSPYYSVFSRTGIGYNSYSERVRLGNLNGTAAFAADTFGIFIGDYSTGKYLTYDDSSGNLVVNGYTIATQGTFGGDGSDGALAISSGTTTLDLGGADAFVKNYTSVSITGTGKLAFTNPGPNGTVITIKSQGNVTITSSTSPALDASGMGAAGGNGDTSNPTDGNTGLAFYSETAVGTRTTGNTGATANAATVVFSQNISGKVIKFAIGSGGGGAKQDAGDGGEGGRGGGCLIIECNGSWNTSSVFSVAGEAGTNGTDAGGGQGGGGGGGGGAGGTFVGLYKTLVSNTSTVTITGGAGGAGGAGPGGGATPGEGGAAGGTNRFAGGNGATGSLVGTGGTGGAAGAGGTVGAGSNGGVPSASGGGGGGGGGGSCGQSYVVKNTEFA